MNDFGKRGTGVSWTKPNGQVVNYWIDASGILRGIRNAMPFPADGDAKEIVTEIIESGKGTFLSAEDVQRLRSEYFEEVKNKPDYELGNPFNEPGWAAKARKSVYRPRKSS